MGSNTTHSVGSPRTAETSAVLVRRVESVPADARLRHFDELPEGAQRTLAEFDGVDALVPVTQRVADEFVEDTVVVFTDYYRVVAR